MGARSRSRVSRIALTVAAVTWLVPSRADGANPYGSHDAWFKVVPKEYQARPEYSFVEADPELPNVLLIGDSISMRYTTGVRKQLMGAANLYRAPDNCRSTRQTLAEIEIYLGEVKWDVIHFNAGIHDLTHLDANGKTAPPPEGRHQIPLKDYRANLGKLIARLKATGAKLIWAATTPIGSGTEKTRAIFLSESEAVHDSSRRGSGSLLEFASSAW